MNAPGRRPLPLVALSGTELTHGEPLDLLLDTALVLGADAVELWYPVNLARGDRAAADSPSARGLPVVGIGSPTELGTPELADRDRRTLTEAVRLAAECGIPWVNTYFGYPAGTDDRQNADDYARALEPVLALAEERGVGITLENEFDCFGTDHRGVDLTRRPAAVARLVEVIGSPRFKLTFDACNALFAGLDPLAYLDQLGEHIVHVHVKDGRRGPRASDAPDGWRTFHDRGVPCHTAPLGQGDVPWPAIVEALSAGGYTGAYSLEPHGDPQTRTEAWRQGLSTLRALLDVPVPEV
ncbi:sugar phosphate isomerase/epimerase family protein [Kitasatospora sp. NPDC097643]|uniref:sugar phosphate isomerase/epimerase family protein n=1 Tax=Kitasatospora sp. NPDC097643 TaxID=3157230 RepID=UPI00331CF984